MPSTEPRMSKPSPTAGSSPRLLNFFSRHQGVNDSDNNPICLMSGELVTQVDVVDTAD